MKLILFTCLLLLQITLFEKMNAQWVRTNGTFGSSVHTLSLSGTTLLVGTDFSGAFRSTNNGDDWTPINSGMTNPSVWSFAALGNRLVAGTYGGGASISTDTGTVWTSLNADLAKSPVISLAVIGDAIFAGTVGRCLRLDAR